MCLDSETSHNYIQLMVAFLYEPQLYLLSALWDDSVQKPPPATVTSRPPPPPVARELEFVFFIVSGVAGVTPGGGSGTSPSQGEASVQNRPRVQTVSTIVVHIGMQPVLYIVVARLSVQTCKHKLYIIVARLRVQAVLVIVARLRVQTVIVYECGSCERPDSNCNCGSFQSTSSACKCGPAL